MLASVQLGVPSSAVLCRRLVTLQPSQPKVQSYSRLQLQHTKRQQQQQQQLWMASTIMLVGVVMAVMAAVAATMMTQRMMMIMVLLLMMLMRVMMVMMSRPRCGPVQIVLAIQARKPQQQVQQQQQHHSSSLPVCLLQQGHAAVLPTQSVSISPR
jgi:hypothetical protein